MFEKAARLKLRFESSRGNLTAEDLFDLPLTSTTGRPNLDDIAKSVHREIREQGEEQSFVNPTAADSASEELQLKLEIVKHVIAIRKEESEKAANLTKRREQKQKLLALVAEKQDEALRGKPLEELLAMVEAL